jgi:hypothetical protein
MTLEELTKKVQSIEDIEAIKNMQHQYIFYVNERRFAEAVNCFAENATCIIATNAPCTGKVKIAEHFQDYVAKMNHGKDRDKHYAVMPVITVEGDKARGEWLLYILISDKVTGKASEWIQWKYENEYIKEHGQWKFSLLKATRGWPDNIH